MANLDSGRARDGSATLAQLVDFVGIYKQDSLLIIRHGKIVVDAYYAPYAPNIATICDR